MHDCISIHMHDMLIQDLLMPIVGPDLMGRHKVLQSYRACRWPTLPTARAPLMRAGYAGVRFHLRCRGRRGSRVAAENANRVGVCGRLQPFLRATNVVPHLTSSLPVISLPPSCPPMISDAGGYTTATLSCIGQHFI
jgi:hypothetical protein